MVAYGSREGFVQYLRTGRGPGAAQQRTRNAVETKFNPYHDSANGQFTFGPGGGAPAGAAVRTSRQVRRPATFRPSSGATGQFADGVYRPGQAGSPFKLAQYRPPPGFGSNSRAFHDPMTLQEVFPGLRNAPGGSIIALGDSIFNVTGPGAALTTELSKQYSTILIDQIKSIDPTYHYDSFQFPTTFKGQMNRINEIKLDRAAAYLRIRGDAKPLQVETLRFLQEKTDAAYEEGLKRLKEGSLPIRLSTQEALGNYIDQRTRKDLRSLYYNFGITSNKTSNVRVNAREYDSAAGDRTYTRPDARVADIAYDVTLTRKTYSGTSQTRGFFNSDFKPRQVVIIRPSQLGYASTYIITAPRK